MLFSFTGPLFVKLDVGATLFHVAVAVAHQLNHCASRTLYEYTIVVGSFCAGAVYVLFIADHILVVHDESLYH